MMNITIETRLCFLLASVLLWAYGCGATDTNFGQSASSDQSSGIKTTKSGQSIDAITGSIIDDGSGTTAANQAAVATNESSTGVVDGNIDGSSFTSGIANQYSSASASPASVGSTTASDGSGTSSGTTNNSGTSGNTGTNGGSGSGTTSPTSGNDTPVVPPDFKSCSLAYRVAATANPYFAGVANNTKITYNLSQGGGPNPTDVTPAQSPVLVTPIGDCFEPGNVLYFSVAGSITYTISAKPTDANGDLGYVVSHQLGAKFGKSNVTAPINSLLGVFLTDADPTNMTAPKGLDFSTQGARDYLALSPKIGQVFFIGTGVTSTNYYHQVIVPAGATRLYFAVMDAYQWNNNIGTLSGTIMMLNP